MLLIGSDPLATQFAHKRLHWLRYCMYMHPCQEFFSPASSVQEILDTLRASEAKENRERIQRKLAHQAELPASGRGSGVHFRHSDILDDNAPGENGAPIHAGLSGGRQHREARRHMLVQQRLRDSVRMIQEDRNSAGPVRTCSQYKQ